MFALSGLSTQRVPANLRKVGPSRSLNATGAYSNQVDNWIGRIQNWVGQPFLVFKSKGGMESVQG